MKKLYFVSLTIFAINQMYAGFGATAFQAPTTGQGYGTTTPFPTATNAIGATQNQNATRTTQGPLNLNYHDSAGEIINTILEDKNLTNQFIAALNQAQTTPWPATVTINNINDFIKIHQNSRTRQLELPTVTYEILKNHIANNWNNQNVLVTVACNDLLTIFEHVLLKLYQKYSKWYGIPSMRTDEALQIIEELHKVAILRALYSTEDFERMKRDMQEMQLWIPSYIRTPAKHLGVAVGGAGALFGLQKGLEWWNKSSRN